MGEYARGFGEVIFMAARAIRRMTLGRASILVFIVVAILTTLFMIKLTQGQAAPGSPTDSTAVPHYFGPWPNWALSPLTLPDVTVAITGDGVGAQATATVGGNGVVTGVAITDPGSGYSYANVSITGAGDGATATASVTRGGALNNVNVTNGGGAYKTPVVSFSGGGATTPATATAYGGIDAIKVGNTGSGYQFPTVDVDMPDDPDGSQAKAHAVKDAGGAITSIVVDEPGSGYSAAPHVVVRDGTAFDPVPNSGSGALATATLAVQTVGLDTFGEGYTSAPEVSITDSTGAGAGATAIAAVEVGVVSSIDLTAAGSGYVTPGGIRKFQDALPVLCNPAVKGSCPDWSADPTAQAIPLAVADEKVYLDADGQPVKSDEYEIAVVQYRRSFNSDLPATLVRGYVQLETPANASVSQHIPLGNANLDPSQPDTPIYIDGEQAYGVTPPQWLGPVIAAIKDKPVRIVLHNLLPTGQDGDLFIPVDTTIMGAGMGPMALPEPIDEGSVTDQVRNPICSEYPTPSQCFKQNRAVLHFHGGITPWISDGTPDQWITPANEDTPWPEGVDVRYVPDMPVGNDPRDGVMTYYYTNQQSSRFLWIHDHSWGITRLNVYAGEASGYTITDDAEQNLVDTGTIPGPADTIPLVVQDRTFVPSDDQLAAQDPTWDKTRWGSYGNLWYHHVYMPAQNPGAPNGMSAYGRWMYGPWFWPPASDIKYGPIDNPYYDASCNLDDPATWQYDTDPFCEPAKIPGTPNISTGMEQFNDTPTVNGVAYPKVTLEPRSYRLRILNAANDRFFNLQWYEADPRTGTLSEVALKAGELEAAQTDPNAFPTPDTSISLPGPDWIVIGSEGGFLPAPTVVDGQQPTTWITDPTRFDVGNVDKHSLVVGPAERSDVIVDFSRFAGKTLILYNDAPAAYPARVPSYDYYTGAPDMSPGGAPTIIPGYGPNTRTVMQVTIAADPAAAAFDLAKLRKAFAHKADLSGVFESSQNPIIVGQSAYNSAYGTDFPSTSDCNPIPNEANPAFQICDGLVRVNDSMQFGFNTLKKPAVKTIMALQPKGMHDEMNSTNFDEFGRMQATLGMEAQPATPMTQNVTLFPFSNPATELLNGTNLPKQDVTYDAGGNAVSDIQIQPMSDAADGTQIWRITHNGVDTHPVHFHLYDVQILDRITWDNIIIRTEPEELGWKDTVRISPLEDTIVALRPVIPETPWEVPNSIRMLNPADPEGSTAGFNNIDPAGNPTNPIVNQLVNYGWAYVWHCHILSHEEMDMMRPQSLAMAPVKADGLVFSVVAGHVKLTFNDNSINETSFLVQRTSNGTTWQNAGTITSPLDLPNIHEQRTFTDPRLYNANLVYQYRVVAQNTVGYGAEFPTETAQSTSDTIATGAPPAAPSGLTATAAAGPAVRLVFTDNAADETGFWLQRATDGGAFTTIATLPVKAGTGDVTYTDSTVAPGHAYDYQVCALKGAAASAWNGPAPVTIPAIPAAPTGLTAALQAGPQALLQWTDTSAGEDYFVVERALHGSPAFTAIAQPGPNATSSIDTTVVAGVAYDYRVAAVSSISGASAYSPIATLDVAAKPQAPTALSAVIQTGPAVSVTWAAPLGSVVTGYTVQRSVDGGVFTTVITLGAATTSYVDLHTVVNTGYSYQVAATNLAGVSDWAGPVTVDVMAPTAPSSLAATIARTAAGPDAVSLTWIDNSSNETGFTIQRATSAAFTTGLQTYTVAAGVTTYSTNVTHGQTYYFRVRASNMVGASAWSNSDSVTTVPLTPTNFRSSNRTRTAITLAWGDPSANETGYQIQRHRAGVTAWTTVVTTKANATIFVDGGRARNTTFFYRIRGRNGTGSSPWSATARVSTLP
jgi:FtsP/CotA-like multicopper oxidase with cupredoxin domain